MGLGAVDLTIVETTTTTPAPTAWTSGGARPASTRTNFTCRSDVDRVRWLAVRQAADGGPTSSSDHRDLDFAAEWGEVAPRRIVDDGRFVVDPAGGLHTGSGTGLGAGTYEVTVGERRFTCLRVLDHRPPAPGADVDEFGEAYLTTDGRTVAYRQFRPTHYDADWRQWQRDHPDRATHRVDGVLFFHRDCTGLCHWQLTDTALGLTPPPAASNHHHPPRSVAIGDAAAG